MTLLKSSGIGHVRGFALGATHYDSTAANIRYGAELVTALAEVCRTKKERRCVTLGIPPTTKVAKAKWRMPHVARTTRC